MLGVKILNNFVSELLSIVMAQSAGYSEHKFINPREGWIFISSVADVSELDEVVISLNSGSSQDTVILHDNPGEDQVLEAMRYLPAGEHVVAISSEGKSKLKNLTVRAVPEITYCGFGYEPQVSESGPYDWDFLNRHILSNINTMVGSGSPEHKPYIEEWKKQGKRWIIHCGAPGKNARGEDISADEVYDYCTKNIGFQNPLLDGVIADEFLIEDQEYQKRYLGWNPAVRKIAQDELFRGKLFYPFCTPQMYRSDLTKEFVETVVSCGYKFALMLYVKELPTEKAAREYLNTYLRDECLDWRSHFPGSEKDMVVCLGYLSSLPVSFNIDPGADFKVYMDMQFNLLANDPAFQGVYGVMEFSSSCAEEEIVRWQGKLYRHYCIEGKTEMLSEDPYILPHIVNPDFDEGTKGWTLGMAEEGSIKTGYIDDFSWLQGRLYQRSFDKIHKGYNKSKFLWTKRSGKKPNTFSQRIKDLEPGKLYSLKMVTADYGELTRGKSFEQKHAISIKLDDAEIVESFQHVYTNAWSFRLGPFNDENKFWMNYHFMVFRPRAGLSRLEVSDWAGPDGPGGPIGQELIYNFIELQPYLEE